MYRIEVRWPKQDQVLGSFSWTSFEDGGYLATKKQEYETKGYKVTVWKEGTKL